MLNFSPSCERNQQVIFQQLERLLADSASLLEIGSGSGQHAVFFAERLSHVSWQPSELAANVEALNHNLQTYGTANIRTALSLDVCQQEWPLDAVQAMFTANTLHIMSWQHVECFFRGVSERLQAGGLLIVYGPFRYNGGYTSASNADFDIWLKQRDAASGIRDFEAVNKLAEAAGLKLQEDIDMPANNQLLVWRRAE